MLSDLYVSACGRIQELLCSDTYISSLSVAHMLDLEILAVNDTPIMYVNVVGLPKMKKVWGCDIEGRDVKTGPGVQRLQD